MRLVNAKSIPNRYPGCALILSDSSSHSSSQWFTEDSSGTQKRARKCYKYSTLFCVFFLKVIFSFSGGMETSPFASMIISFSSRYDWVCTEPADVERKWKNQPSIVQNHDFPETFKIWRIEVDLPNKASSSYSHSEENWFHGASRIPWYFSCFLNVLYQCIHGNRCSNAGLE